MLSDEKQFALIRMLKSGRTVREIRNVLGVSQNTVTRYRLKLRQNGETIKRRKRDGAYKGCDEDCFHCGYSDCLKPAYEMRSDDIVKELLGGSK